MTTLFTEILRDKREDGEYFCIFCWSEMACKSLFFYTIGNRFGRTYACCPISFFNTSILLAYCTHLFLIVWAFCVEHTVIGRCTAVMGHRVTIFRSCLRQVSSSSLRPEPAAEDRHFQRATGRLHHWQMWEQSVTYKHRYVQVLCYRCRSVTSATFFSYGACLACNHKFNIIPSVITTYFRVVYECKPA